MLTLTSQNWCQTTAQIYPNVFSLQILFSVGPEKTEKGTEIMKTNVTESSCRQIVNFWYTFFMSQTCLYLLRQVLKRIFMSNVEVSKIIRMVSSCFWSCLLVSFSATAHTKLFRPYITVAAPCHCLPRQHFVSEKETRDNNQYRRAEN